MGLTYNRARHRSGRNRDQRNEDQHQYYTVTPFSCYEAQSVFDCSSNSRALRTLDRQKRDTDDRYAQTTTTAATTVTTTTPINEQLTLIHTVAESVVLPNKYRDDKDDIDTSLGNMDDDDDDYMVECNDIEKSIPSKLKLKLSVLEQLKFGFGSSVAAIRMSSSKRKAKAKSSATVVCHCKFEIMFELLAIFAAPFWLAGTNTISCFTHMINFKRKFNDHHRIFTLPSPPSSSSSLSSSSTSHTELETIAPPTKKIHNNNKNQKNKIEYECRNISYSSGSINSRKYQNSDNVNNSNQTCDLIKSIYKGHHHNSRSIITSSQYFIRQSVCLYAASGFFIALCFLAIPAAASIDSLHPM